MPGQSLGDEVREEATVALRGLIDKVAAYLAAKRGQFDLELYSQISRRISRNRFWGTATYALWNAT